MTKKQRIDRLAKLLGITPNKKVYIAPPSPPDGRGWKFVNCVSDVRLPFTAQAGTISEALDIAESWLIEEEVKTCLWCGTVWDNTKKYCSGCGRIE